MKSAFSYAAVCAAAALASPAAVNAAVTVDGSVSSFSLPSDPGLALTAKAIDFGPFTLNKVGSVFTTNVFSIGTTESSVDFDDIFTRSLSATFTFDSPIGAGGTATGSSAGFFRLFSQCGLSAGGCGRVKWNNPTIFNFGNGGQFSVNLSDVEFTTPGTAVVSARFELLANAVPEPTTWALLILGFGVIGGALRSQRKTRVQLTYV